MSERSFERYIGDWGAKGSRDAKFRTRAQFINILRHIDEPPTSRGREFWNLKIILRLLTWCGQSNENRDRICRFYGTSMPELRQLAQTVRKRLNAAKEVEAGRSPESLEQKWDAAAEDFNPDKRDHLSRTMRKAGMRPDSRTAVGLKRK